MANRTVALTAARRVEPDAARVRLNMAYVAALESAGLVPIIVPPLSNGGDVAEVVSRVGGLVLTGGGDLNPALYGEPLHPKAYPPEDDRDATELAMIAAARAARLPTLAICRGIQALNVALGGSLIQDIASQVDTEIEHDAQGNRNKRIHEVVVEPGTRLAKAVEASRITVNSLHHQAVATIAPGLRVSARSPDGVIEGLETTDDWWVLAVQWHPEEMDKAEERWDRGLFRAFAAAVGNQG